MFCFRFGLDLRIACRMILLLVLCFIRCVVNLIEQPSSTLMLAFPYVRWLAKVISLFFPWLETRLPGARINDEFIKQNLLKVPLM